MRFRIRVRVKVLVGVKIRVQDRELTGSWGGVSEQPCSISSMDIHVASEGLSRSEFSFAEAASVGSWRP